MKVVVISGSPRKNANTQIMMKYVFDYTKSKNENTKFINLSEGGFDYYVAEDSTITVEERRVVVAATTVSAVAAARPAIQTRPIMGTSPASGPSIPQRRRNT